MDFPEKFPDFPGASRNFWANLYFSGNLEETGQNFQAKLPNLPNLEVLNSWKKGMLYSLYGEMMHVSGRLRPELVKAIQTRA